MKRSGGWRGLWKAGLDAAGVAALYGLELTLSWDKASGPAVGGPSAVPGMVALLYLPLLRRRQCPLLVLAVVCALSLACSLVVPGFVPLLCVWLALYSVGVSTKVSVTVAAAALVSALLAANILTENRASVPGHSPDALLVGTLGGVAITLAVAGVGRWVGWSVTQRRCLAALAAREAIDRERNRIARELHDVVAHSITLMVLQADGAARNCQQHPAAAEAMASIVATGGRAVSEMRAMLNVLATETPVPAADREDSGCIMRLVKDMNAAGMKVIFHERGLRRPLSPQAQHAAFLAAREALTNAARYSDPACQVTLTQDWTSRRLRLEVINAADPARQSSLSTGRGLDAMRKRVEDAGGNVTVELAGTAYSLRVDLPLARPARAGQRPAVLASFHPLRILRTPSRIRPDSSVTTPAMQGD